MTTFWFFKSLDINMVYALGVYVYIYKIYLCRTIFLWVECFQQVEKILNYFQNHTARMIFFKIDSKLINFKGISLCKNLVFKSKK